MCKMISKCLVNEQIIELYQDNTLRCKHQHFIIDRSLFLFSFLSQEDGLALRFKCGSPVLGEVTVMRRKQKYSKPKEKSTCWFLLMEKSLLREAGERQLEKDECSGLTVPSLLSFDSLSAVRVLDAAAGGRLKPLEAGGFVRSWRESQELSES